jgi:uncharacterized membrane protein HdeD (DUF308 family)
MRTAIRGMQQNFSWLHKNWLWFLTPGIIFLVLGALAIALPVTTSIVIEVIIGILLIISGVVTSVHSFYLRAWKGFALSFLVGLLQLILGTLFLMYPIKGVIALTFLLAICLLMEGAIQMSWAFLMRSSRRWGWLLLNGIITLILGGMILFLWPNNIWMIGLLVGINFAVHGFAFLIFALDIGFSSKTAAKLIAGSR